MKISVTQEDIDNGIPSNPNSCPVALAFKRALPADITISVVGPYAYLYLPDHATHLTVVDVKLSLPDSVWSFVRAFDFPDTVVPKTLFASPFEFDIDDASVNTAIERARADK